MIFSENDLILFNSKRDIRALEAVQRRATKLVPRIRNWSYDDRLTVFGSDANS